MLRKCPHHDIPEHMQLYTFYHGLKPSSRNVIDAAAGGSVMGKTTDEALLLLNEISESHQDIWACNHQEGCYSKSGSPFIYANTTNYFFGTKIWIFPGEYTTNKLVWGLWHVWRKPSEPWMSSNQSQWWTCQCRRLQALQAVSFWKSNDTEIVRFSMKKSKWC